jgi:CNT family concentrative nucleoside transporter
MGLQFALGLVVMRTSAGVWFFEGVRKGFEVITDASAAGGSFVFGNLNQVFFVEKVGIAADGTTASEGPFIIAAVIAFRVLPVIIFVSGLSAILLHLGIVQWVIRGIAWVMRRTLTPSSCSSASNPSALWAATSRA